MKPSRNKVIITCAITGSVHTPSMSPHLPVTPDEIAQAAIEAAQAGAAIVHLHARQPGTGQPTQDPALYAQFLPRIKEASDVVINITTGGSPILPLADRMAPALRFKPEVASLNMGSMNFGMYELLERFKAFEHAWERPYLEGSNDLIFKNTFKDIEHILASCGDNGTRFEIECYDIGHLYTAAHFVDRKLLKPPFLIQSVFGIRGGIGTHPEDVMMMKRTADRLFGADYTWSVLAAGRKQTPLATMAATMGGNVRVGLEDSLWDGPGELARSNADQVRRIRRILEDLSMQVATPDEARATLQLKGGHDVAF
ncbi:3-keto-5-aminohexanoate cleavage protein [Achromobacter xylosoxidans]|uniref:3-keto-5-aminohexanoate cleavage protein n=1 Tax=Alcaligenes xylosoxydans xylosoxydans TaxID=85698 RepID=UPI001EED1432|nr:3-keto-5-aminohexanoate cleavage protein [Achromobacter xylosoxidans]